MKNAYAYLQGDPKKTPVAMPQAIGAKLVIVCNGKEIQYEVGAGKDSEVLRQLSAAGFKL